MIEDSIENEKQKIGSEETAYSKLKVLGEGSMGKVYLVKSNADQQLYVMKRINIGYLSQEEKQSAMRQAQLHSLVSHPNIIRFKEIYHTTKDKLCIIMEYAEGGDLDEFIQQQNGKLIPELQVLTFFSQICLGVREIHNKKIIHRDLKGANIFLSKDKKIKIGDFGISKIADQTIQASKSLVGTPYFLSPQMVEGKKYSAKADIWSLGVILYHLCTLKLPFEAHSLPLLALKILKGSFPPITGPYSRELKSLILSMLQVNQIKRPTINEILSKPLILKVTGEKIEPPLKITSKKETRIIPKHPLKRQTSPSNKQKQQLAKKKRDQLRKQMQDELRQKVDTFYKQRKEAQKARIEINTFSNQAEKKQENLKTAPVLSSENTESNSPKVLVKPWKIKKIEKQDVEIQLFLPEDRPKKVKEPLPILKPEHDFHVEIFVSKNPPPVESKLIEEIKGEENHCRNEIDQMLNQVNGVNIAVQEIQGNFPQLKLLQDSEIFQAQGNQKVQKTQLSKEEQSSLKFINSSENLEECRQILEEGLGEEKFIWGYNILNEHLSESTRKRLEGQSTDDDYTFNRELIREKLKLWDDEEFNRYVVLLYTLIIMEGEEMKKNLEE